MSSVTIVLFLLCLLICHVKLQCSAKATVEQIGSSFSRSSTTAGNNGFSRFQSTKNSFTNTPNESTDINDPSKLEIKNANEFLDRHSRIGFIRKVYSIFTVQTLTSVAVVAFILNNPAIGRFLLLNSDIMLMGTTVGMVGSAGLLTLLPRLRHQLPLNLLVLGVYTLCQSTILGTVTSTMDQKLVCAGAMHTLVVFLGMTLFAFQPNPKYDLTPFGTFLLNSLLALTVGVVASSFFRIPITSSLWSGLSAILFSVYIAYDTQLIVGGRHKKRAYDQKEYILAVLGLYQDAVSLFLNIMRILNSGKNRSRSNKEDS